MKRIAVFCGSSAGQDSVYIENAKQLGEAMAANNKTLVYGGAQVGCMGAVANAVLDQGGQAIGVIPQKLMDVEIAHEHLTELHVVETMHERKAKMADLADGFVALPGGAGTLEEWFEVFTWAQLGYHDKPIALLNVNGFYDPLIQMLDHTIDEGFMKKEYRDMIIVAEEPAALIDKMNRYEASYVVKW
ncbi:MAG: TIGR00730 family Rossman fold protein [Bacillota bacterium]|uniref:Cytokinin riboside 5'-monophosphate phosphoribohydrolase n=1 Tax=Virgibacillus salarius TaxID=447199 RepID=A0A941ICF7_9BACI|nr:MULTISPECIES: TIGR00730 family Rossman fold protein [Bacillaceae]NAZ08834.1 TIGR00730 family Rossman fold protein [Agaribacter marinus]MBR7796125.1 TIGR00730 family Rossman fold protein [Virgibacillus salarius]MCC2252240.1 TIGR00730 family Rossman fold protein [Virgibacillus sp. AGTR]MDY7042911.1 TIGR00730 family Rossman fold protein [Virgibacillus sp. M23]QRZ20067.1 TIGR00730 family Rossman fold protein [Virgibacillus sp. AGTR]